MPPSVQIRPLSGFGRAFLALLPNCVDMGVSSLSAHLFTSSCIYLFFLAKATLVGRRISIDIAISLARLLLSSRIDSALVSGTNCAFSLPDSDTFKGDSHVESVIIRRPPLSAGCAIFVGCGLLIP